MRLDIERTSFRENIQELLTLEKSQIIHYLLESDLAAVYSAMDNLRLQYEGRWYQLKLSNETGKKLYPLFQNEQPQIPENHEFIAIHYALNVEGMDLGEISFLADWGKFSEAVIDEIDNIRNLILLLIIVALMVTLISQYHIVYKPLKRLVKATEQIAAGHLDNFLPIASNDEIGELTRSFNAMMVEIKFQKRALDYHAIVSTTDAEGLITYANKKFLDISQYELDEVIGRNHSLIKSDLHPREFFTNMWDTIQSGNVWQGEICNRSKNGNLYWVSSTIVPFINRQGVIERFISIRTDITRSKLIAQDLQVAKESAESGYRAKSDFLANMSHEIRTPMNAIIGFSDLAISGNCDSNELQEYLQKIQSSSKILLNLINDILDLTKIENGKMMIESICFDLPLIIDETMQVITRQYLAKPVNFTIKIHPAVPSMVIGDPNRLGQVLMNLVGNAFKFTEQGSITLALKSENQMLQFSVEDTGIGMTEEQVETIFEAFTQADVSTTRRFGGTGLGTTISKYIVEQMGGRIWVESQPGQGSRFYFEIPLIAADEQAIKQYNANSMQQDNYKSPRLFKILLAEDIEVNARLVMLRMEKMGHQVDWVMNGAEATAAVKNADYDLVLMDMMMPVMNGREATQAIRQDEQQGQHLPIIALTASVMEKDRKECIESGMDAIEFKPVNFNKLLRTMERVVAKDKQGSSILPRLSQSESNHIDFTVLQNEVNYQQGLNRWGDPTVYLKALKSFAKGMTHLEKIKQFFNTPHGDIEQIKSDVHNLKGVTDNLGIHNLALMLNLLERLFISGDIMKAQRMMESLTPAYDRTLRAIEKLKDNSVEKPSKQMNHYDQDKAIELIYQVKAALSTLNPDKIEPLLEQMEEVLPVSDVEAIIHSVAVFDFKSAEQKLINLESSLVVPEGKSNA